MRKYLQNVSKLLYFRSKPRKLQSATAQETIIPPPPTDEPKAETQDRPTEPESVIEPEIMKAAPMPKKQFQKPEEKKFERNAYKAPMLQSTYEQLFLTSHRGPYKPNNKVTIFGTGPVGTATVFSLLAKGVTNDISMIDFSEDKLQGELMDLRFGSKFLTNSKIRASKDYAVSTGSKIIVLAPCAESGHEEGDYDRLRCNAEVLKAIVPQLLKFSPDALILVALDPVDVLTKLTWQVSELSKNRVFGTGTSLYSASFRYLLANRLGLTPSDCHGYIIGENGDSCVPVWSGVTAGGVHLRDLNPDIGTEADSENWRELHQQVLRGGQQVRELKGHSSWATALCIADICSSILNDANCVRPLSTYVKGEHNINDEIFLSLPCVVGRAGVLDIIRQPLTSFEAKQLRISADIIAQTQSSLKVTS